MSQFMASNEFESRVTSLSKDAFYTGFFARKMRLRANILVDFFEKNIGDCTESARIFLQKQFVKRINGRGGVLCRKNELWEMAYFINYIG